jgi:hypothetical protein
MTSLKNGDVLVIDTLPFGVVSKLEMKYIQLAPQKTLLHNLYSLDVPIFFFPLRSLIPKMIKKWNDINWSEDLPLKMRRQRALDWGSEIFMAEIRIAKATLHPLDCHLPVRKTPF